MSDPRDGSQGEDTLSASEAAALLGVKKASLYAYAARGLLESLPGPGRERRYARRAVERLKARRDARAGHGAVAAGALRFGAPVVDTEISAITPEGPSYRGRLAVELAEAGAPFEAVCEWLWRGGAASLDGPTLDGPSRDAASRDDGSRDAASRDAASRRARTRTAGGPRPEPGWDERSLGFPARRLSGAPIDGARYALALLDVGARARPALSAAAELERGRRVVRRVAAAAALPIEPERAKAALAQPSVAGILTEALLPRAPLRVREAVNAALVLTADHELNASTFTARVVASTGADLLACLNAAACALSGPLHGASHARVERLFDEASKLADPGEVVFARVEAGEAMPGFGHPLYPGGDPRGKALLALAERTDKSGRARPWRRIADAMAEADGPAPNLDFGLVALSSVLGLPRGGAGALFATARCAGWIAHVQEQRRQGFLLRPTARFVGPRLSPHM